ncbi:unnamed protein product [Cuscuta campestris]|uniref:Beta-galactosidase n=1 Tax=Cuscuta campestris TaxID=132261 RepID=A0A484NQ08_9ASTE|nr:unnamed protein product [Cuscuta campestris]
MIMEEKCSVFRCTVVIIVFLLVPLIHCSVVNYDRKAIVINGRRRLLISGSIHYPRSAPEMWEDLIIKAKEGGLDVIETYVFWNVHEPSQGNYNFEGRNDLVRFVKTIQKAGLYAHLRIGPYVCAEWNFGGFPVWLKYVPGISFRTDNEPFKVAMKEFTEKIVNLMKMNELFASQGGPIILTQIENEYGSQGKALGPVGYQYANWAANMALRTGTGVPWVMCKQEDAPDPVINTCNGFYCDAFIPNRPYKPTIWTENWTGWFSVFGGARYERRVEDVAFAVANFIQKGGSFVNYYMYHGGTNFGRTAGGPFITTSYDFDAPLDEYGLIRQPKYGHLKELHRALKLCEGALVSSDPTVTSLGPSQQAHTYAWASGGCAAILSNYDTDSSATVTFNNVKHKLPPWSISILPDCRTVVFNTAQVGAQTSEMGMLPADAEMSPWEFYSEDVNSVGVSKSFTAYGLLDQINVTRDTSDYLWYTTTVDIPSSESFLQNGELPTLLVQSEGHALMVFVNGQLSGSASGTREYKKFVFSGKVKLRAGKNRIALLSVAVGLPNIGTHFEEWDTGILGAVAIYGLDNGKWDLSHGRWTYQIGLAGEAMELYSPPYVNSVRWRRVASTNQKHNALTWYKSYFDEPEGDEPLGLNMGSMGKGQVWINGQSIGRYWTTKATGNCTTNNGGYTGRYKPLRNQVGCGYPTQQFYHVPRSWLRPRGNLLVVFEEHRGDPSRIAMVKRSVRSVCADVSEFQPNVRNLQIESSGNKEKFRKAKLRLECGPRQYISSIKFASFGTPLGTCGKFSHGPCHAPSSYTILEKECVGKASCSVTVGNWIFGDPCSDMLKRLKVEAICSTTQ